LQSSKSTTPIGVLMLCQVPMRRHNNGEPYTVLTIRPEELKGMIGWRCRLANGDDKFIASQALTAMPAPKLYPGMRVECRYLHKDHKLNCMQGLALEFCHKQPASNRWFIRLSDGIGRKIHNVNLVPLEDGPPPAHENVMATGRRVRLHDLVRDVELNGRDATLIEFNNSKCRWSLRFDDGSGRRIKSEKLKLLPIDEVPHILAVPTIKTNFMEAACEHQDGAEVGWYDVDPAYDPDGLRHSEPGKKGKGSTRRSMSCTQSNAAGKHDSIRNRAESENCRQN